LIMIKKRGYDLLQPLLINYMLFRKIF